MGKDDQQDLFGDEEEPGEVESFDFEIVVKGSLALLEMLFKLGEEGLKHVHRAALDDLLGVRGFLHDGEPSLVDLGEEFGLSRQLLGDVSFTEDWLEGLPTALHLHPQIKNGVNRSKLVLPLSNLLLKGANMSIRSNRGQQQLILFQLL